MNTRAPIHVTACAWELPAYASHATLPAALQHDADPRAVFDPETQLGKKGLRYKEKATLMALCAAKKVLQRAGFDATEPDPLFGVAVACNTGNLDTVCNAAQTIRDQHVNATSSMDLPNASSNVIASTLAIRFKLRALNLLITSGASAGFDALVVAANAIRNGRAERMLVIGVETSGPALRKLLDQQPNDGATLMEGAIALVLESTASAQTRMARSLGSLGDYVFANAGDASQPLLYALLNKHPGKTLYPGASCFLRKAFDEVLNGHAGGVVDIDQEALSAYGSGALLQLVHHLESRSKTGALIAGGGTWGDQRTGLLAVDAAAHA